MQLDTYSFLKRPVSFYYEFFSEGPKGKIKKVVEFYKLRDHEQDVYNIAFGDWDEINNCINDRDTTNNSDRDKVLATVAATLVDFMNDHPMAIILAIGSMKSRTRLYQMAMSKMWEQISLLFEIQGYVNYEWHPFQKGINFDAFLLKGK